MNNILFEKLVKDIKSCSCHNKKDYYVHEPIGMQNCKKDVIDCIQSTYVSTSGKYLDKFKNEIKKLTKSNYVVLTNTGTSALFMSLKMIDIKNTEILIPSMTFVATTNVVKYLDGIPHFIDCEKKYPTIDLMKLKNYLSDHCYMKSKKCINKKTNKHIKGLIAVHAFGYPVDIPNLKKLCSKYNIEIIEDGAGALGSYINNKHIGTFNNFGILSFNGNKIVTTGMGGAILIKYKKDYLKINHLINVAKKPHDWKLEHNDIGYNFKMSNINASLGYRQLKNIKKTLKRKRNLHNTYLKKFIKYKFLDIMIKNNGSDPNYWLNNLIINKHDINIQTLIKKLHKNRIYVRELWKPQHLLPMFKNYPKMNLSNSINLWKTTISLPSSYIEKN